MPCRASASGKLDRGALPLPDETVDKRGADYTAPRTELERQIAGIWAEALRLEQVGVEDNFFDLGGDSILAIQIIGIY